MRSYYVYLKQDDALLFTVVCLPDNPGQYPTIVERNPYVDDFRDKPQEEVVEIYARDRKRWTDAGYAFVSQQCRGHGKSTGVFHPYVFERQDGLALQQWVREQAFYNGELYLYGGSYTACCIMMTAPFAPDIKAAFMSIQDCTLYGVHYQNGFYKIGMNGGWAVSMYTHEPPRKKNYTDASWNMLPLRDLSKTVFGSPEPDFDEYLKHPDKNDPFWKTELGGGPQRDGILHARIPLLLMTGYYDIFPGGCFDLWHEMDEETRSLCTFIVCPYNHGLAQWDTPYNFPDGVPSEHFPNLDLRWFESLRGNCPPITPAGKITYYRTFENRWVVDDFPTGSNKLDIQFGQRDVTYTYNPYDPATFPLGVSRVFGGLTYQKDANFRYDVVSFFSDEFKENVYLQGKMKAVMTVRSDCEDTCFYIRVCLVRKDGVIALRDDIQQISNIDAAYVPGTEIQIPFDFDEHSLQISAGEKIRIDVASSYATMYVRHTNNRGHFADQTTARVAHNTVVAEKSLLTLPLE